GHRPVRAEHDPFRSVTTDQPAHSLGTDTAQRGRPGGLKDDVHSVKDLFGLVEDLVPAEVACDQRQPWKLLLDPPDHVRRGQTVPLRVATSADMSNDDGRIAQFFEDLPQTRMI